MVSSSNIDVLARIHQAGMNRLQETKIQKIWES